MQTHKTNFSLNNFWDDHETIGVPEPPQVPKSNIQT